MPKISIIIPVYNVKPYINQALDSVVNQTLNDIEIICVDDCSTDGSYDILQEYAQKDKRFVILKQDDNQGPGAARNRGLDIASGKYIMFLDPDDWYENTACEDVYAHIEKYRNDFVYYNTYLYYEDKCKKVVDKERLNQFKDSINNTHIKFRELKKPFMAYNECWYKIYLKAFLNNNNIRFPNEKFCEDLPFYIKCILYAKDISILNKPLYNYRQRNNSAVRNPYNYLEFLERRKTAYQMVLSSNNKSLIDFQVVCSINSIFAWFYTWTNMEPRIKKDFYIKMQKFMRTLNSEHNVKELKQYINYKKFKNVINQNWYIYKYKNCIVNFCNNIFSVKNKDNHKVITICGLKLRFLKGVSIFSYRYFSYLIAWIFPLREDRAKFRGLCREIDDRRHIIEAQKRYIKLANKIKKKKEKIRVLFLVSENSKWKTQSLYDLMAKSEKFEPIIAVTLLELVYNGKDTTRNNLQENYKFFKDKNMNVVYAYENKKFVDLKEFKPDIIFYSQPWSLHKNQSPDYCCKFALLCYIPYYVNNYTIQSIDYNLSFHKYLFRHYVLTKEWENEYKKITHRDNIYGLGHTILDHFYLNNNKNTDKNYVIYAPHFSFCHPKNENPVNYGTFSKNGKEILEFAKGHPEFNWVFKPHPQLKHSLLKIGLSREEVSKYWNEWAEVGKVCEDSSYIDLFLDSKALITDCGSFLTEYFCTGKPIIHLISEHIKVQPNHISEKYYSTFYKVNNLDEMYQIFDKVLVKNEDEMKGIRLKALDESGLTGNYAAKNIIEDLENVFI